MVAEYACNDGFELANPQDNRMYCSQSSWVGKYPICSEIQGYVGEDGGENDCK